MAKTSAATRYRNFDLTIQRDGEEYRIRVDSDAGQASAPFRLPFSDMEIENFYLSTMPGRRSGQRVDSPEVAAAKRFGERLFNAVFTAEVMGRFHTALSDALHNQARLRIRMKLTEVPELANLPWEYLYNSPLNRFLILENDTPLVRYLEMPEGVKPVGVQLPLRVLVVISSPTDLAQLDVEQEWANLREALGKLEQEGLVDMDLLEDATLSALNQQLSIFDYNIIHFIGHGAFEHQSQEGVLIFKDKTGLSKYVSGQQLGVVIHNQKSLVLAVLNACEGATGDHADAFAGTAQRLMQQGIPAVVAMQREITDDAAKVFAHAFYSSIAAGQPVELAMTKTRITMYAEDLGVEWATPVLYMRATDGYLFDLKERAVTNKPAVVEPRERVTPVVAPDKPANVVDDVSQDNRVLLSEVSSTHASTTGMATAEQVFDTDVISLQNASKLKILNVLSPVEVGKKPGIVWRAHFLDGGRVLYVKHAGRGVSEKAFETILNMPKGNVREGAGADYGSIKSLLLSETFGVPIAWGGGRGRVYSYVSFRDEGGRAFNWLNDNSAPNFEVRFSRDTNQLVLLSVAEGKRIRVWKVPNWPELAGTSTVNAVSHVFPVSANIVDVDLSFDGRMLACATNEQLVRLWNTDTGQPLRHLDHGQGNRVHHVEFSRSGKALATILANGVVRIWTSLDSADGHTLVGNSHKIIRVAFSPDGTLLATGSLQSVVYLWNVSNGSMLCSVDLRRDKLNMNAYPNSMEFSPDGRVLACGMQDGFIRLLGIPS